MLRWLIAAGIALATTHCAQPEVATPVATNGPSAAAACPADASAMDGWDTAAPPYKIFGNTWYVGTCGISAVLVTSPQGHVLVDAGTEKGAPHVAASIRAAGFALTDIKYIVGSHEHNDHAGGMAELQRLSGATVLARAPAAAALRSGNVDRSDPQFLIHDPFPAIQQVQAIEDGHSVRVGELSLQAHASPGHTPGGSSWTWRSCEADRCLDIAYLDSVSAISDDVFRYSDEAAHPGYLAAFRSSIDTLEALPCDVLVTPHPAASLLRQRIGPTPTQPLSEPAACRSYAEKARANLDARLAQENQK